MELLWVGLLAVVSVATAQTTYQQVTSYTQTSYPQGYQNRSLPYGNYSSGASMYGNYSKTPNYPPSNYGAAKYQNNSYGAYNQDPFSWTWDHLDMYKHNYDEAAQRWLYDNWEAAWNWGWNQYQLINGKYYQPGYTQQCGYSGNPYNTLEWRTYKRAEVLVYVAQWYWDNFYGPDKQVLHNAFFSLDAKRLNSPFVQECYWENFAQWDGTCQQYQKYSRPDQICNNIAYPTWGAWLDIKVRISNIWNYENGIYTPMRYNIWPDYNGQITYLVDAKVLANALDNDNYGQCYNLDVTMMHAYFTQFIVHDIVRSAAYEVVGYNGQAVKPECCRTPDNCLNHNCAPWRGNWNNGYSSYPVCESFSYNQPGLDYCLPIAKDVTNLQTAYIDLSQVYGASCYEAAQVRAFRKGKLKINKGKYGLYAKNVILPDDPFPDPDYCDTSYPDAELKCLLAGDKRAMQHPGLLGLTTLFVRMHNRCASSCAKWLEKYYLNEDVVDEICYQETRRMMVGVTQIIFYRDHLKVELGEYITSNPKYGLGLDYVLPYDAGAHASVWPEYAYAAGRHHTRCSHWSQIVDEKKRAAGYSEPDSWYGIYDWFNKAYGIMYSKHKLNELFSNAMYDPEQCWDTDFVPELRNVNPGYGGPNVDMFWTNLVREREIGMPWYSEMWKWCGIGDLYDWSQLQYYWNDNCLKELPKLVYHVKNIEAYVGMICEKPLPGAVVGPTAACVLQRQYYNLREADRFFVDRNGFTYDQLNVLKKFNLGKILCITTNLDYVTENVFKTPNSYTNKYQSCNAYDDITEDDLSVIWSTIPYANGDYRTCKEYGGYGYQAQYQNATYGGYQNNSYAQQPYQQPAYQQPAYQQPAYQQPAYNKPYPG